MSSISSWNFKLGCCFFFGGGCCPLRTTKMETYIITGTKHQLNIEDAQLAQPSPYTLGVRPAPFLDLVGKHPEVFDFTFFIYLLWRIQRNMCLTCESQSYFLIGFVNQLIVSMFWVAILSDPPEKPAWQKYIHQRICKYEMRPDRGKTFGPFLRRLGIPPASKQSPHKLEVLGVSLPGFPQGFLLGYRDFSSYTPQKTSREIWWLLNSRLALTTTTLEYLNFTTVDMHRSNLYLYTVYKILVTTSKSWCGCGTPQALETKLQKSSQQNSNPCIWLIYFIAT